MILPIFGIFSHSAVAQGFLILALGNCRLIHFQFKKFFNPKIQNPEYSSHFELLWSSETPANQKLDIPGEIF